MCTTLLRCAGSRCCRAESLAEAELHREPLPRPDELHSSRKSLWGRSRHVFVSTNGCNRSGISVFDEAIDYRPEGVGGESFLPEPRRQAGDVAGRMALDTLQHVHEVDVGIKVLESTRGEQAPAPRRTQERVLVVLRQSPDCGISTVFGEPAHSSHARKFSAVAYLSRKGLARH